MFFKILGFFSFYFSHMYEGLPCIDIEVLLRQILTHLLMPRKALCRFIQLGRNGVTQNEKMRQNLQTWVGLSSGLLIFWSPCWTHCHWFLQNLLSGSKSVVFCFLNQTQYARNEVSRVAALFLVISVQFTLFICVIQQQFEREIPVEIGFGLQLKLRFSCCLQWPWIKPQMVVSFL